MSQEINSNFNFLWKNFGWGKTWFQAGTIHHLAQGLSCWSMYHIAGLVWTGHLGMVHFGITMVSLSVKTLVLPASFYSLFGMLPQLWGEPRCTFPMVAATVSSLHHGRLRGLRLSHGGWMRKFHDALKSDKLTYKCRPGRNKLQCCIAQCKSGGLFIYIMKLLIHNEEAIRFWPYRSGSTAKLVRWASPQMRG